DPQEARRGRPAGEEVGRRLLPAGLGVRAPRRARGLHARAPPRPRPACSRRAGPPAECQGPWEDAPPASVGRPDERTPREGRPRVAGPQGFEPRPTGPKPGVLPLVDGPSPEPSSRLLGRRAGAPTRRAGYQS